MALRSGVSRFARPVAQATEADLADAAHNQAETVLEAITDEGSDTKGGVSDGIETTGGITALAGRGGVREPVSVIKPEPEIKAPSAEPVAAEALGVLPKRRGPKPGTPRPPRKAKLEPEAETPVTAVALRAKLKDLEATIKETRAKHEKEMMELRTVYRHLHDQLFDLTK